MLITIVNKVPDLLPDNAELLRVIRAISRQCILDFEPYWHLSAGLRLAVARNPDTQLDPVTGGAIIYLDTWKDWATTAATLGRNCGPYCLGFHERVERSQFPVGYVFVDPAPDAPGRVPRSDWTVSLSHEVLEMIANPHLNLWVRGPHPHPEHHGEIVWVSREVCDPVQDSYELDGVLVANFVLPHYFIEGGDQTERVEFLGTRGHEEELTSFGIKRGGYVPYRAVEKRPEGSVEVAGNVGRRKSGEYVPMDQYVVSGHLPIPHDECVPVEVTPDPDKPGPRKKRRKKRSGAFPKKPR